MVSLLQNGTRLLGAAEGGHHGLNAVGLFAYIVLTCAIIFWILASAKKGLNPRYFTNWFTQRTEQLYLFLESMAVSIIGDHGKKYLPMLFTFWIVIFVSNVLALFMPSAPTADLSFNLGMAIIAIMYVQYEGIRTNGLFGHLSHFAGPKLPIYFLPLTLMIFVIEIISESMKMVSLPLRLFGNIDGGHQAAEAMNKLGQGIVPIGAFLLPIKLLTCVVQALIFTLLFSVYLSLVTQPHHHDDEHAPAHAH